MTNPAALLETLIEPTSMKTYLITALRALLPSCAAAFLTSCATFDHPLARHDMDGDGALSHSEYQQNSMQYNMARRQRVDEYDRARQIYRHVANANDILGGTGSIMRNLRYFGQ